MREWNNLQYVSSTAFLLTVYSDYLSAANTKLTCPEGLIQPQELLNFAKSQVKCLMTKTLYTNSQLSFFFFFSLVRVSTDFRVPDYSQLGWLCRLITS